MPYGTYQIYLPIDKIEAQSIKVDTDVTVRLDPDKPYVVLPAVHIERLWTPSQQQGVLSQAVRYSLNFFGKGQIKNAKTQPKKSLKQERNR